jgi:DNA-binding HxlR family transcriptional regulator
MSRSAHASSDTALLQILFHYRWAAPILAELHNTAGSKFITLTRKLAAPKESVQRSLQRLIRVGWVKRNSGHGHPLRPEYLLTAAGEPIAQSCARLMAQLSGGSLEELALKKWSMPIVSSLGKGPQRFSELKSELSGITSRALTLALKELVEQRLVEREVSNGYPPTVVYRLEKSSRGLQRSISGLR